MYNDPFYVPSQSCALFFRSDTREPDKIFETGFQTRLTPNVQIRTFPSGRIDVEPNSCVCITRDFAAAAIFPVANPATSSWVYIMDLPLASVANVHAEQYASARQHPISHRSIVSRRYTPRN